MPVRSNSGGSSRKPPQSKKNGIRLGPGVGKHRFRVRQVHVRDHYAPLIAGKAYGAVKLDLLLRCIALSPGHTGARKPGFVLWPWSYEDLHDLIKDEPEVRHSGARDEQAIRHLKRKWVRAQLDRLAALNLVRVTERPGHRSEIFVLRDDGTGKAFDDPGRAHADAEAPGLADAYFTIQGSLIAAGELRAWKAAELAAYFAALVAELQHPRGGGRELNPGHGRWWRPLAWFTNDEWDPPRRILLPFSKSLLEQGLANLATRGVISVQRAARDPRDPRIRFNRPRNIYQNRFDRFDGNVAEFEDLIDALADEDAQAQVPGVADVLLAGLADAHAPRSTR